MPTETNASHQEWITSADVARRLGVSARTVYRMIDRGDLKPRRLPSGHRRYLASEVDTLLAEESQDAS
ncbi:MAG TPA: helix-turn-helix domain-containing protein [Cellulomonadaceae bacterium]|nr:helix-turn-helix domain-containing protein [Cellulomonadaceae bacterium]